MIPIVLRRSLGPSWVLSRVRAHLKISSCKRFFLHIKAVSSSPRVLPQYSVRLYRLLRFEAFLRHNISGLHLAMALTFITFIRNVLFKLRNCIFVALVHSSTPAPDFSLFAGFLTQWLGRMLRNLNVQPIRVSLDTVFAAFNVKFRSDTLKAFQTSHALHIVVSVALIFVYFNTVNQFWIEQMLVECQGLELVILGPFPICQGLVLAQKVIKVLLWPFAHIVRITSPRFILVPYILLSCLVISYSACVVASQAHKQYCDHKPIHSHKSLWNN